MRETGNFATKEEAIRAAIDDMEPGDTLYVHEQDCRPYRRLFGIRIGRCSCTPKVWEY